MPHTILIHFVPHTPAWAARAARDANRVRRVMGEGGGPVHHVGATSVPGLSAVPIVDLAAEIATLALLTALRLRLLAHGFRPAGTPGVYHAADPVSRCVETELRFYPADDPAMEQVIALFAYLRANPAMAKAYEAAKQQGRARHGVNHDAYHAAKQEWVQRHLDAALHFWRSVPVRPPGASPMPAWPA